MSDPETLTAELASAVADLAAKEAAYVAGTTRLATLRQEVRKVEAELSRLHNVWGKTGEIPAARRQVETLRKAIGDLHLPTLTMTERNGKTVTVRVESLGPKQMVACSGYGPTRFKRKPSGTWESYEGTIAPFDEAAIIAAIKAAREIPNV